MAEGHQYGYQHPRPPRGPPPGPPPSEPPPLPAAVRPGFPPPLGKLPPPPPPPLTNPAPPPPPPCAQPPLPPLPNPEPTRAREPEPSTQKADQSDRRWSDVSHDASTRISSTKHDPSQAVKMSSKDEGGKFESVGSKVKMSFGGGSGVLGKRPAGAITMKLKPQMDPGSTNKKLKTELPSVKKTSSNLVAQAFGSDSEEEEEMPPEAKLRMRNIGKDTPTSAGPNSFNKSARGFSDPRGSWRNEVDDY